VLFEDNFLLEAVQFSYPLASCITFVNKVLGLWHAAEKISGWCLLNKSSWSHLDGV